MRTREDIEAYLLRANHPFTEIADATWLVGDAGGAKEKIVVHADDALCVFRLKVIDLADIDAAQLAPFYGALLEMNATEMVHSAYGVADGMVLLTASHLLENLDYAEFAAVIEEQNLAMASHHERLATFRRKGA